MARVRSRLAHPTRGTDWPTHEDELDEGVPLERYRFKLGLLFARSVHQWVIDQDEHPEYNRDDALVTARRRWLAR